MDDNELAALGATYHGGSGGPGDDETDNQRSDIADEDNGDAEEARGVVDLFGNEISAAVATYKFDSSGSLYEVHSPRTELPRLGLPKS